MVYEIQALLLTLVLYFLSTYLLQFEYDQWSYNCYTIPLPCNTWSHEVVCRTIRGCASNKNYYFIIVVCIQIVLHWGINRECGINQVNTVYSISTFILWSIILRKHTKIHFISILGWPLNWSLNNFFNL